MRLWPVVPTVGWRQLTLPESIRGPHGTEVQLQKFRSYWCGACSLIKIGGVWEVPICKPSLRQQAIEDDGNRQLRHAQVRGVKPLGKEGTRKGL